MTKNNDHAMELSSDATALYVGSVMHARLKPVLHRFQYKVFSLLIDIDQLDAADTKSILFSVAKRNIFSFYPQDHGDHKTDLRAYIDALFQSENIPAPSRVKLLCYPRIFNFAFNPISVYFCYEGSGQICAMLYEVRNTFGQSHSYFAPLKPGEASPAGIRQELDKLFYVSPFMKMNLRYKFRIGPPQDTVRLRIMEDDAEGPILSATFFGEKSELNTRALIHLLWKLPFQNLKIVGGIHWEALKLWIKGMRLNSRPAAPPAVSIDGHLKPAPQYMKLKGQK